MERELIKQYVLSKLETINKDIDFNLSKIDENKENKNYYSKEFLICYHTRLYLEDILNFINFLENDK